MSKRIPTNREQEATILQLRSENSLLKAKLAAKRKQQRRKQSAPAKAAVARG